MNESARDQARSLPENPGCYLMKNSEGTVIYVGKAKNLKRRVNSYFLPNRNAKTAALVEKIATIDYMITGNEYEALVLENNLIKKYNPHYNILLKDGKSYPLIRITNEEFPRVFSTRRVIRDGSEYYGPYPVGKRLGMYLDAVKEAYPLRLCQGVLKKGQPCLYYHMKKCSGPCIGAIGKEEYGEYIKEVKDFLKGDDSSMVKKVEKEMLEASKALDFETAAKKRDLLEALRVMQRNQSVDDMDRNEEGRDYAAIEMRSYLCTVSIMQFRSGRLIGKAMYRSECMGDETETLLSFLVQYYSDGDSLPEELYVSHEIDAELLSTFFKEEMGRKLKVEIPREGKHYRILRMAGENASRDVEKRLRSVDNTSGLERLKEITGISVLPRHLEGFDIAQLSGKYTVASMIVFRDGNPSNKEYRHFSMKSLEENEINDFQSMYEAVFRRYRRLRDEKSELPDLLMVDGGIGQVNAAIRALDELGLSFPVVGLAERLEEIVFPDNTSILLDHSDPGLRVLIALRDECHRFATSFNQRMRSKEASFSLLESIEGVGKARSRRIMEKYVTVEAILSLTAEELSKGAGIPLTVAERVLRKLNF